jgi:putative CocE/NonD family hydrolase
MRDGVEIAVTVLLPPDLKAGERVPVLMRTTRYWRGQQIGWGLRVMVALHLVNPSSLVDEEGAYFNQRRFALILVDARGSGASGGRRPIEYAPAEIGDMGEVAAWTARQPWSNGRVGTFGVSYDGNAAELAAAVQHPAIRTTPAQYNQALTAAGEGLITKSVRELDDATAAAVAERRELAAMIGTMRGRWKQWEWLGCTGIAAFVLGYCSRRCSRARYPLGGMVTLRHSS